ncbi:chemotaxis protein CheW [Telmatospirillum siberiense]|uniref:Chemotaxis protein CheW n=1 Tax=Telmatospirillum siberiense TaxID=382514 RepID=A0A2N3Q1R9_9PROT|nr:chemotaxis protein CheW [Telmatospirillum siberiense]PKU26608.1 chemotaxis protein CheW [Telmatospirillum siberiense]
MSEVAETVSDEARAMTIADAGDARQFVIFHVADEMFAVRLAEVQEIIRMPEVVRVPLSPGALEGLANLRGTVLPVIRLRQIFGMTAVEHDDATRVVILDQGRPVGLVVDRVANVVTVESDRIEPVDSIQGTVDNDLMTGMIKASDGTSMVMILDAGKVVAREFKAVSKAVKQALSGGAEDRKTIVNADDASDESQLVSFEVAGQEYALPIEQVQEIVQIPEQITEVPNTSSHVLGVMTLRNRLLPLVSLRDMFGLPPQEVTDANKIVVVSLSAEMSVGVMMDSVKEVLRVGRSVIDPMPALLARDGNLGEIQSICRLNEGQRLVSILSSEKMFNSGDIRAVLDGREEGDRAMTEDGVGTSSGAIDDEEQFVVFRLMNEEYGVPIDAVQEIVRVPDELTRVPKTPDFLEGVINLRGVVLPVVDQRRRFGLPTMEKNDRQRIMVYTIKGVRTGFIVDQVLEVMRIPASVIGPSPDLSEEQQRLIRRVANIEKQHRMILLLDIDQLLDGKELSAASKAAK